MKHIRLQRCFDKNGANACTNFTGSGTGLLQLTDGDVIFFLEIPTKLLISTIANNTTLTLSSGTSLGDGTENQKIGRYKSNCRGPGKAYIKGMN